MGKKPLITVLESTAEVRVGWSPALMGSIGSNVVFLCGTVVFR